MFYWDRTHDEWVEYSDSRSNLQEIPQRHETSTITSDDVFKKWFLGRSSWVSDEDREEILTSLRACGILRKPWKPVEESVCELQVQHAYCSKNEDESNFVWVFQYPAKKEKTRLEL